MAIVFTDISECLTLEGASQKEGRRVGEVDLSIVPKASLVVEKGRIAWVGKSKQLPKKYSKYKKKSLNGQVVVPAFVECHTHSIFAGNRAAEFEMKCQGKSYLEIAQAGGGIVSTVKATRKASEAQLKKSFDKACSNFLKQGVVTLEVKSGYGLSYSQEMKMLRVAKSHKKLRVVSTYLGPHAKPPEHAKISDYLEAVLKDLEKLKKNKLADRVDIFVENNYFSQDQARAYFEKAKALGFEIVCHTHQINSSNGIHLSVEFGARSCDHLNQISSQEIQLLSKSSITGVVLPTADYYLGVPYPPVRKMLDSGVRIALSTDYNPGSSPTQSLNFVGLIARREMGMTLPEVLSSWTVAPSYALGLEDQIGSLSVGKFADFLVLDGAWQELFYRVGDFHVEKVFKQGKELKII